MFQTPKGKDIEIYPDGQYGMYLIKFKQGGELPKELSSLFTNYTFARNAVDAYLSKRA